VEQQSGVRKRISIKGTFKNSDLVESITEVSIISTEQPGDSSAMSVPESIVEGQGEYDLNLFDDQNNEVSVQQLASNSNVAMHEHLNASGSGVMSNRDLLGETGNDTDQQNLILSSHFEENSGSLASLLRLKNPTDRGHYPVDLTNDNL